MMESQNIEWKETWRDEYLKWICGFANAHGGSIFIGKNDAGKVTGISNTAKLLEDIPNKVKDILGILIDVNVYHEGKKEFLEIITEAYPYPISYKGSYHYRSGSTKQELKGAALDKFLLQKQGKRWDGVPVPNVTTTSLSKNAFAVFKNNASKNKRIDKTVLQESNRILLEKLHLTDNKHLKRAAILLFHPDPEKFITGAYIKIGYFKTDDDLVFQDDIHGSLFEQVEKITELLLTKYLKATISYQGVNRIESYSYPEAAIREALLNSITHKDYSSGNPIQISVYDNKIIFWNSGSLPDNWTAKKLMQKHPSIPFNPDIAGAFFRAGLIETWGRGTLKIVDECKLANLPAPSFEKDENGVTVIFKLRKATQKSSDKTTQKTTQETTQKTADKILEIIKINPNYSRVQIAESIGNITADGVKYQLEQLKSKGRIKRIGGDKGGYWEILKTEDK
jgi:ATP-dependent DNA helicase RecG